MNRRLSKTLGTIFLLLELAIVPKALELMLDQHFSELPPLRIVALAMTFGSIALCILLSFSALSDNDSYPRHSFLFELMVFVCCIAPMTDLVTKALEAAEKPGWNMAVNSAFYLAGSLIAYLILRYELLIVGEEKSPALKKRRRIASALMLLHTAAVLLNVPFGFFFTITESGAYRSAPTFGLAFAVPAALILLTVFTAAKEMPRGRQQRAFFFFWIFAILSSLLQVWQEELSVQYTGYTLTLIVIYLNIQSELDASLADAPDEENA